MTKSAVSSGIGHSNGKILDEKIYLIVQCCILFVENLFLSWMYRDVSINPVDL